MKFGWIKDGNLHLQGTDFGRIVYPASIAIPWPTQELGEYGTNSGSTPQEADRLLDEYVRSHLNETWQSRIVSICPAREDNKAWIRITINIEG